VLVAGWEVAGDLLDSLPLSARMFAGFLEWGVTGVRNVGIHRAASTGEQDVPPKGLRTAVPFGDPMDRTLRHLMLCAAALVALFSHGQGTVDSLHATPDHWVAVDLKKWAWYLNFTHEHKAAVRAVDARYAVREAQLNTGADYVDTDPQRAARRALVAECTAEVQAALDSARFARWLNLRNGAQPVKPSAGGTWIRLGPGRF